MTKSLPCEADPPGWFPGLPARAAASEGNKCFVRLARPVSLGSTRTSTSPARPVHASPPLIASRHPDRPGGSARPDRPIHPAARHTSAGSYVPAAPADPRAAPAPTGPDARTPGRPDALACP
ncbi:hypothetical protein GCM10010517_25100 [Streptosporangium fragile]|uniref:Uncharacterized protein n=1 Tax=Streptosporangium fragile TaxID=46186 RepID=A0ABN3VVW9_9ACTN